MQFWIGLQVEYMQRINEMQPTFTDQLLQQAEIFCLENSKWVKENSVRWVDCLKKSSNADSETQIEGF